MDKILWAVFDGNGGNAYRETTKLVKGKTGKLKARIGDAERAKNVRSKGNHDRASGSMGQTNDSRIIGHWGEPDPAEETGPEYKGGGVKRSQARPRGPLWGGTVGERVSGSTPRKLGAVEGPGKVPQKKRVTNVGRGGRSQIKEEQRRRLKLRKKYERLLRGGLERKGGKDRS